MNEAIRLYKKFGFKEVPVSETDYIRVDIQVKLNIEGSDIHKIIS